MTSIASYGVRPSMDMPAPQRLETWFPLIIRLLSGRNGTFRTEIVLLIARLRI
jgi:hypothetical protein